MNKPMKFISKTLGTVRGMYIDGEAWLVGKDVCKVLGYKDHKNALKAHVDDEDKKGWRITTPSRGDQQLTIINESGLFSLIMASRMPEAHEFKRWVTHEVLPAIRKTGEYQSERDEARAGGKVIRRKLTDTIKKFLEYLKERGELDRQPVAWYSAFSKLVNDSAGVDKGNRDNLNALQLFRLQDAEDIAAAIIEAGMSAGKAHHDIWTACQAKLDGRNDLTKIFNE